ncbi:hypothetical protein [Desmospora profundinema]|uniref:SIS domain-containing protein n=1 Tax=Desmospora profundinema TaxID=1571184 RepID=A0ABU1IIY2_9BACL|nr:hypothetical protein [Desmospora profundinema]MDR6224731.1 hypothetical protein [Desmospora profundinema]
MERTNLRYRGIFTKVPGDPSRWRRWEAMGEAFIRDCRRRHGEQIGKRLVFGHGEGEFPRFYQLLAEHGTLEMYGSLEGFHSTFMGKKGQEEPGVMLERARMKRGETILLFFGNGIDERDPVGMAAVEAAVDHGGKVLVVTWTERERHLVEQRWHGHLTGVTSIEAIGKKVGERFDWPHAMPYLPDPEKNWEACREVLDLFQQRTVLPLAEEIGQLLGTEGPALSQLDLVMNRAGHDALGLSLPLLKPRTGRLVFAEEMAGRRYSFYAPQVWADRRQILMPTASIVGMGPVTTEVAQEIEEVWSLEEKVERTG